MSFLLKRLLHALGVVLVVSLLVFVSIYTIGDPVDILISPQADQAEIASTRASLGLDQLLWRQYASFLSQASSGDLGRSFVHNIPALQLVIERLPATLELAVIAMLFAVVAGVSLGLWAAYRPHSAVSKMIMGASLLCFSLPTFWIGLLLILYFCVHLGWLPASGRGETVDVAGIPLSFLTIDGLRHLALPALTLGLFKLGLLIRLTRATTREQWLRPYVTAAKAKGLKDAQILIGHVLRNIAPSLATVIGIEFGSMVAFSVVTETIFAWPGVGRLLIDSIALLDRPVIVAYVMLTAILFIALNLLVDMVLAALDPRIRMDQP